MTQKRVGRNFRLILLILIAAAAATVLALVFMRDRLAEGEPVVTTVPPTTLWPYGQPEYSVELPEGYEALLPGPERRQEPQPPRALPREKTRSPVLIIVIDDAGYNLKQIEPFLKLPFPLTIAVLPGVEHSSKAAEIIAGAGKEAILHQPMQALGGNNTGPGAILLGMDPAEATKVVEGNLASLPQVIGVNNHMGSAVTRDETLMRSVLELVKNRGIYYLDSLTAPDTVTARLTREMNIPYWERDVFLDNSGDRQSILRALEEGKKTASARGAAVLIGHVWSAELAQTLAEIYPRLVEEGYSFSTISKFMIETAKGSDDARSGD